MPWIVCRLGALRTFPAFTYRQFSLFTPPLSQEIPNPLQRHIESLDPAAALKNHTPHRWPTTFQVGVIGNLRTRAMSLRHEVLGLQNQAARANRPAVASLCSDFIPNCQVCQTGLTSWTRPTEPKLLPDCSGMPRIYGVHALNWLLGSHTCSKPLLIVD